MFGSECTIEGVDATCQNVWPLSDEKDECLRQELIGEAWTDSAAHEQHASRQIACSQAPSTRVVTGSKSLIALMSKCRASL